MNLIVISSGFCLGLTMGIHDASNAFRAAGATGMIRFPTAALLCRGFMLIGAVTSRAGATDGLGRLETKALPSRGESWEIGTDGSTHSTESDGHGLAHGDHHAHSGDV